MTATEDKMARRKMVLDALGAYQNRGRISDNIKDMADLLTDESDRGVVVILGSLIEDILLERLMQSFVTLNNVQRKNLTRGGGLLNSFHHRVSLAHALGVIDEDMVEMLQTVKAMRNACAHSRLDIEFLTPELRDALGLLFGPEDEEMIREATSATGLRLTFIVAFVFIAGVLRGDSPEDAGAKGQRIVDAVLEEAQMALAKLRASREKRRRRQVQHRPPQPND